MELQYYLWGGSELWTSNLDSICWYFWPRTKIQPWDIFYEFKYLLYHKEDKLKHLISHSSSVNLDFLFELLAEHSSFPTNDASWKNIIVALFYSAGFWVKITSSRFDVEDGCYHQKTQKMPNLLPRSDVRYSKFTLTTSIPDFWVKFKRLFLLPMKLQRK